MTMAKTLCATEPNLQGCVLVDRTADALYEVSPNVLSNASEAAVGNM